MKGRVDFYMFCRQNGLWPNEIHGYDPAIEAEWFTHYQAKQNVTPNYPPTLLLHGEADTDVDFELSELMSTELAKHAVRYQLISQPHWGRTLDNNEDAPTVMVAHERILEFLGD